MIERVVIRNLKRFKELDCTLAPHLVIVGRTTAARPRCCRQFPLVRDRVALGGVQP